MKMGITVGEFFDASEYMDIKIVIYDRKDKPIFECDGFTQGQTEGDYPDETILKQEVDFFCIDTGTFGSLNPLLKIYL